MNELEGLSLKTVERNWMRNSEGMLVLEGNTWLLFTCFDFEQFMRSLGEDFLGSLENGARAGVRGRAEDTLVGMSSYRKGHRGDDKQWG